MLTRPRTFTLPAAVTGTHANQELARDMIAAWRSDGIFQVTAGVATNARMERTFEAMRRFFGMPLSSKARCANDLGYSGYTSSGQPTSAGEGDFCELFTACRDLPLDDPRVRAQWPCHGPVPWPDEELQQTTAAFLHDLGELGDRLLKLVALGLHLYDLDALTRLTEGGWHHLHAMRLPAASWQTARGIGSHTDYGLLAIGAQDQAGGLEVRPPVEGEQRKRGWRAEESTSGMYEELGPWVAVPPAPQTLTVMPGDLLHFMTEGYLLATPQKVQLGDRERFSLSYFHEPAFTSTVRPLFDPEASESIHYGTHFTGLYMRWYTERAATRRIVRENRLAHLPLLRAARQAA